VCFIELSRTRRAGEKIRIGGLALKTLKKLNGETLALPFTSIVLAKAIGLQPTELCKYLVILPYQYFWINCNHSSSCLSIQNKQID
jgi:hypothetical protein